MAKKTSKPDPYAQQAANLTTTRYGPEISALTALMRQAESDRDLRMRQATSGRQYAVGAVDQAGPQITSAYRGAGRAVSPAFAQGGGIEAQALTARLGESQALAQSQLAARRVSAIEGEGAAKDAALRDFRTDQGKIGQRAVDLTHEQGAFTASTIQDLMGADASARADARKQQATLTQQERNSLRSAGIDPDTNTPIPNGPLDPKAHPGKGNGGKGWATTDAHTAASDEIARLLGEAKDNAASGESRADTAALLAAGIPQGSRKVWRTVKVKHANGTVTTKQEKVLNPDGTQVTHDDPGFAAAKSQLLLQAALDMAYDGHLSRKTQALLHSRKLQIGQLGDLVTFGEWLKTPAGQAWRQAQTGGINRGGGRTNRSRPGSTRSIRDIYG